MENQRIRLTKKMLKSALIKLLESKPIEKISVYELCAEAQINRTTFYKYYGSQHDLMADIQADFLTELENSLRETDRPLSLLMILNINPPFTYESFYYTSYLIISTIIHYQPSKIPIRLLQQRSIQPL